MLLLCRLIRVVFVGGLAKLLILEEVQPRFRDEFFSQKTYRGAVADLMINLGIFKVQILNVHDKLVGGVELLLLLEFVSSGLGVRAHI